MSKFTEELSYKAEKQAISVVADQIMKKIDKTQNYEERSEFYCKLVDYAGKFIKEITPEQTASVKEYVSNPNNRWMKMINSILDNTDPRYGKRLLMSLGYEAFFRGTKQIRESREKYNCNIPWLILFDPTMACNMHCKGCWSGTYGRKASLSYEEMDKIVTEGKELGVHLYMCTGGEPMVKWKEIAQLAAKHEDCFFALYSNSTLITDEVCKQVQELGNVTFMLSIEGTPETNDARRGDGHYDAAMKAMDLLKEHGIVFGTSICYTRENVEAVTSDEFFQLLTDKGAHFGFYFHFMPVGNNAVPELMPTVEQRKYMIHRIREVRSDESDIQFFPMDFQNDGEYVGGCIAGGRNYFHINSNGDGEPCVFIHFSNMNIKENSILEILQSPLFMAYHKGQPFNHNHLRPCPMLENPEILQKLVHESGAHQTNVESPETVEHLCEKCKEYSKEWAPEAQKEWDKTEHKTPAYENYAKEN